MLQYCTWFNRMQPWLVSQPQKASISKIDCVSSSSNCLEFLISTAILLESETNVQGHKMTDWDCGAKEEELAGRCFLQEVSMNKSWWKLGHWIQYSSLYLQLNALC